MCLRERLDLDKLDHQEEVVTFIVPQSLYTISTSFFMGAFGPSVRRLGIKKFETKYVFSVDAQLKAVLHGHALLAVYQT